MPFFAAADWFEILAALIFFAITGIAQWLQKRSRDKKGLPPEMPPDVFEGPWAQPGQPLPPVVVRGEPPPPSRRPAWYEVSSQPLPPSLAEAPPPLMTSAPVSERSAEDFSWEDAPPPSRSLSTMSESAAAYERGARVDELADSRVSGAGSLAAAAAAIHHASNLHDIVAARISEALARTEAPTSAPHSTRGRSVRYSGPQLGAILTPDGARQALIASLVFGRPKALE